MITEIPTGKDLETGPFFSSVNGEKLNYGQDCDQMDAVICVAVNHTEHVFSTQCGA